MAVFCAMQDQGLNHTFHSFQLSGYFKLDIDKNPTLQWQGGAVDPASMEVESQLSPSQGGSSPPFTADPKDISIVERQPGAASVVRMHAGANYSASP
jgi:hypothetical protein